uniref:Peregrinol diphosphate synthase CPS1, chloroplastic n=1 Tax=Marrubium vulgare TaxID=41230 RepID=CPS1_MARVU|nr:RecName: Full=Peregrinol diphosphate synthase CPS1, chloroplastic; AltName: Full=(+)-copalyl diphosphate synthase 1; Short=MvCPS1; Flags: Precursor [Marrubium vulgare]AIE77090.1 peregrinol diphosphate synthase [Marrubium vulgare]
MASTPTLNLSITTPFVRTKIPAKISLPACSWLDRSSSRHVELNHKFCRKLELKVAMCRASLDVQQVRDEVYSNAQPHELVDKKIEERVKYVKNLLSTMDDGRINWSAYDTAWISLIKDFEGRDCPQFPSTLERIAENQLPDGSWGDKDFDCSYDRIINTLACVVALTTWNVHPEINQKGIRYLKENMRKLEETPTVLMTCAFEVVFPALLKKARNLGIHDLPYDMPIVKEICKIGDEKLARIPKKMMEKETTSLMYAAEGVENLDWERLLKLRTPENGSFLSSPAATVVAFMHTKDEDCLRYIKYLLNKFNGGAPNVYPVDLWSRLWATDRLQRLGISRYFESEIKDLLSYVHSYWTDIGVYCTRDSKYADIDDTSMGFRLLRVQGYNMDANVFKYFQKDDKFVCLGGQMNGSATATYNLYRAAQYQFPGEQILEDARKFSQQFLQESIDTNNLLDKWVISPHIPEEMRFGMEMTWYSCLPRIEASYYLQHYGATEDVWLGKTFFRMEEISNENYRELAILDFSKCQAQHQTEWIHMQEWYESNNVKEFGISRKDLLFAYFLAAASIFETERAKERILWARSKIICKMVKSFLEKETGSLEHKIAFLTGSGDKGNGPVNNAMATLHQLLGEFDGYISIQLENAWAAWLTKLEQGEANDGELLATTINICGGRVNQDTLSHNEYKALSDLTNKICHNLAQIQNDKGDEIKDSKRSERDKEVEQDMQALAKLVFEESDLERSIKQTFLAVVRTYYYGAYIAAEKIDVHMFKVLFKPVG